jgi:hypothetical protein
MGGVAAMVAQGASDAQLYRGLVLVDITPDIDMAGARRILSFMAANPNGYADLDEAVEAIAAYRGPGRGKSSRSDLPGYSSKARMAAGGGIGILE